MAQSNLDYEKMLRQNPKLKTLRQIAEIAKGIKKSGKKIITTNGAFDILHAGHVMNLNLIKSKADVLILGLNSDSSVKMYKGPDRPINNELARAMVLAGLESVDYIVIFQEREPSRFIEAVKPDFHAKGDHYSLDPNAPESKKIFERDVVERNGGKIILLPVFGEFSTTNIIKKIQG